MIECFQNLIKEIYSSNDFSYDNLIKLVKLYKTYSFDMFTKEDFNELYNLNLIFLNKFYSNFNVDEIYLEDQYEDFYVYHQIRECMLKNYDTINKEIKLINE